MLSEDTRRIELIESHLQNTLTAEEQIEFKHLLATDPTFGEELKETKALIAGLNSLALERFQSQLVTFEQTSNKENQKPVQLFSPNTASTKNIFSIKRIASAAAVVALLVAGPMMYFYNSGSSNEKLFAKYSGEDNMITSYTVRGTDDAEVHIRRDYPQWTSFNEGIDAFSKKNYAAVEALFLDVLTSCPADVKRADAQVFLGMTYMSQGHTEKALDTFTGVVSETSMEMELDWNKALCMVRLNKLSEAKEILKAISTDNKHEYQRTASNLLEEL